MVVVVEFKLGSIRFHEQQIEVGIRTSFAYFYLKNIKKQMANSQFVCLEHNQQIMFWFAFLFRL